MTVKNILHKLEQVYFVLLHKVYKTSFRFLFFSFFNLDNATGIFANLFDKKIDGVIIKNFLTENEIEVFFKNLLSKEGSLTQKNNIDFGYTLGTAYQESDLDLIEYHKNVIPLNKEINALFGFNFNDRVIDIFNKLSDHNMPVEIATSETGKQFLCSTIRFMEPKKGGLIEHVHLSFYDKAYKQPNMSKLKQLIDFTGELSFYVPLQYSEVGGELRLYNLLYENVPEKLRKLTFDDRRLNRYVKHRKTQLIKPCIGDMIIFNGGSIWHRITPIDGTKPRITIGGFANFSQGRKKIILWS